MGIQVLCYQWSKRVDVLKATSVIERWSCRWKKTVWRNCCKDEQFVVLRAGAKHAQDQFAKPREQVTTIAVANVMNDGRRRTVCD